MPAGVSGGDPEICSVVGGGDGAVKVLAMFASIIDRSSIHPSITG